MGTWLFTLQLQISIAVVVILLLRQAMKKMPKVYSYVLWLLVFARLLVPVTFETRFSFMPSEQEQEVFTEQVLGFAGIAVEEESEHFGTVDTGNMGGNAIDAEVPERIEEEHAGGQLPGNLGDALVDSQRSENSGKNFAEQEVSGTQGTASGMGEVTPGASGTQGILTEDGNSQADGTNEENKMSVITWLFIALWAVGAATALGYNGIALGKVRRSLQNARLLPETIQLGKGNAPVYVSEKIHTPFSLGFLRPVIYLPAGLSAEEQGYILCHERVHISRKDNLVKHVAFLLTAIYWFNPFVWVAFFLMERDMEMSCDEKVLKLMGGTIKRDYSQSLLNFAAGQSKMPATHLTFGENSVKQRVKNVLSYKNAKKWTVGIGALVLVIVVLALFTTGREESEQVDGRGDQVETDGPGQELADGSDVLNQGEESQGGEADAGQEPADGGNTAGQENENQGNGNTGDKQPPEANMGSQSREEGTEETPAPGFDGDVQDPIHASLTTEEALRSYIDRFLADNMQVSYSNHEYDKQMDTAVIRYTVSDSLWKSHVMVENVKIVEADTLYTVEQVSLTDYSTVETAGDFKLAYGVPGSENLKFLQYGYGFYRHVIQQLQALDAVTDYYTRLTDPVQAVVDVLNLGPGNGVAKLEDGTIISGGGPGSVMADIYLKEDTCAYVTYTFDKDGSTIELPVYLIEESHGLWSMNRNDVREIYETATDRVSDFEEKHGYSLEFTSLGIYRKENGVLTNIYPYNIQPDLAWAVEDDILYFPTDSQYQEGYLDWRTNVVCMLDVFTGEYDKETLSLESLPTFGLSPKDLWVYSGFVHLQYSDATHYTLPLVNTGNTHLSSGFTYNGKAVKDLTAEEQDAYGVALRDEILKSGEVMKLSNRTLKETYAYVDLDGDGKTEEIRLTADTSSKDYAHGYGYYKYDWFRLWVGDRFVGGQSFMMENELRFFSPDGKNIVIMLYGHGHSDDYVTMLFTYKDGKVQNVGEVQSTWESMVIDQTEGVFRVKDRFNEFIQPVWLWETWRINEAGQVEEVPQESYDMIYGKYELPDLLVPLPVYEAPGGDGEVSYIQPQKVDFIKMDSTRCWVYLEAADGSSGWFGFEVEHPEEGGVRIWIKGLDLKHSEVFTPYYAG